MSIRCGNYKWPEEAHYHATSAEVKACFDASLGRYPAKAAVALPAPDSEAASLFANHRDTPTAVLDRPKPQVKRPFNWEYADVPVGCYALRVPGGEETDGELTIKFYEVSRPEEGTWAGATFVAAMASDELHPVRGQAGRKILALIQQDPEAAAVLYGQTIGVCGLCGRKLTDEVSRARGIGPVCAQKVAR